jgi:tetratricopeptide (TPR) repeat protein
MKVVTLGIICTFASAELAHAQNLTSKYGADSVLCLTNISLYREVYKQKNYKEAYSPWKAVVTDCPLSTKYIFVEGPVILEALIKDDPTNKEQYLKDLFDLFDLRIKSYPEDEGYTLGRIGVYTVKYGTKDDYPKAYDCLGKSIDLSGDETSPQVLDIYFQVSEAYMKNNNLPADIIMDAYDKISAVMEIMMEKAELKLEAVMHEIYKLDESLENNTINEEDYKATYETFRADSTKVTAELIQLRNVENNLDIRFSVHATCEMLKQIYGKKLETSKDERTLRQIIRFFNKTKDTACTESEIYITAVEELHKLRPAANTALFMGKIYSSDKRKQHTEAINYFKEAVDLSIKESEMVSAYILMAECYLKTGQNSAVRETANKIIRLKPNSGIAYILIGDAYLYSGSSCNSDIPGAVYWAAADKYAKAKAVDASVADAAQKKLNDASARFPKIDVYFQRGYQKGQSYKVECWINETTTIR